jgi:ATP-dependent RNA helicase DDX5/DBP2
MGGGNGYRGNDSKDQSRNGATLKKVRWDTAGLQPFSKDFHKPSETALKRSSGEIDEFLQRHEITVKGNLVPQPTFDFRDNQLPDFIMGEITKQGFDKPTAIQAQGKKKKITTK